RLLTALAARRGDGHRAVVLDVDRGARRLLDAADRLALGPDDLADLGRVDLDGDDPRSIRREFRTRLGDRLLHLVQDVQTRPVRPLQRLTHDLVVQPLDLDVHLDRGDPFAGARHLEVHVTERVLEPENVGEYRDPIALLDQAHRDAGTGR